jgi:hypothetical protein
VRYAVSDLHNEKIKKKKSTKKKKRRKRNNIFEMCAQVFLPEMKSAMR